MFLRKLLRDEAVNWKFNFLLRTGPVAGLAVVRQHNVWSEARCRAPARPPRGSPVSALLGLTSVAKFRSSAG
jgi:hypothetical protein